VCLSPPPPPPATPASPTNELSSIRGSASAVPETVETSSLQLTPPEILQSPVSSPSLQPAQHSPRLPPTSTMASSTSAASTEEVTRLRLRLRHTTAHVVGLAAMVAQLPPLTPDMPLMATTLAIRAHFTVPSCPASNLFRRLLTTNFSSALPRAQTMSPLTLQVPCYPFTNIGTMMLTPINFFFLFLVTPSSFCPLNKFCGLFV